MDPVSGYLTGDAVDDTASGNRPTTALIPVAGPAPILHIGTAGHCQGMTGAFPRGPRLVRKCWQIGMNRHTGVLMTRIGKSVLVGACTAVLLSGLSGSAVAAAPTCFGTPATLIGTSGDDLLVGQSGVPDVIVGLGGNDVILGGDFYGEDEVPGAAPDILCGGPGDDHVNGGPGPDRMSGGDGADRLGMSLGADTMLGNRGADRLDEGSEADADSAPDVLRGGPGDDVLITGWGRDRAYGQGGADQLDDIECGDTYLDGGAGNDTIDSYLSSFDGVLCSESPAPTRPDRLFGGAGVDTARVDPYDRVSGVEQISRPRSL